MRVLFDSSDNTNALALSSPILLPQRSMGVRVLLDSRNNANALVPSSPILFLLRSVLVTVLFDLSDVINTLTPASHIYTGGYVFKLTLVTPSSLLISPSTFSFN